MGGLVPFEGLPDELRDQIIQECLSKECGQALAEVQRSRNAIVVACEEWKIAKERWEDLDSLWKSLMRIAAFFFTLAAIAFSLSGIPLIGAIAAALGAVLAAIGTGFLVTALVVLNTLATPARNKMLEARDDLETARRNFRDAVEAVLKNCNQYCWGDLTQPECS